MGYAIKTIERAARSQALVARLVDVWEASVRATHDFVSDADVKAMRPDVPSAISGIAQLALVVERDGTPIAFAGAQEGKLEMLFVSPEHRGAGVGRALLRHAVEHDGVFRLDCNAQNRQAVGFYEHEGFEGLYRTSCDDAGRPFPLVRMYLADDERGTMRSGDWFEVAQPKLERDRMRTSALLRRFNGDASLEEEERTELLKSLLGSLGSHSTVADGVHVDYGYHVFVGDRSYLNFGCVLLDGAPIVFGDDVWVGPRCTFATPLHPLAHDERSLRFDEDGTPHIWERNLPIVVGNGVWIASNVTVNPGVTIGDGAVIGSGSVVTKDVPPRTLAFGNPCRPIRAITEADRMPAKTGSQAPVRSRRAVSSAPLDE